MVSGQGNVGRNASTDTVAKKQTSTERRIQNRKAQKAYRKSYHVRLAKDIDAFIGLFGDTLDGDSLQVLSSTTDDFTDTSTWNDANMWLDTVQLESNLALNVASNDMEGLPAMASTYTPTHPSSTIQHTPSSAAGLRVIHVSGPSGEMASFSPRVLRAFYTSLPKATRDELRALAKVGDFTFVNVFKSRLRPGNNPSSRASASPRQRALEDSTYCPYRNVLHIARFSYFVALFTNFGSLGFDFSLFLDETSVSPFVGRSDLDNADVPSSLRPLACQRSVPHHPYIDSLPFPEFRRRALAALLTDPPLLDEDDLCIDLMLNDGLVCWGSTNENGMDRGTPWDRRSWEAKGWFLRKWWWLVGGQDGELWQSSQWWASQLGEQISTRERKAEGKDIAVGV